jgi:hypothetical protein
MWGSPPLARGTLFAEAIVIVRQTVTQGIYQGFRCLVRSDLRFKDQAVAGEATLPRIVRCLQCARGGRSNSAP